MRAHVCILVQSVDKNNSQNTERWEARTREDEEETATHQKTSTTIQLHGHKVELRRNLLKICFFVGRQSSHVSRVGLTSLLSSVLPSDTVRGQSQSSSEDSSTSSDNSFVANDIHINTHIDSQTDSRIHNHI